MNFRDFLEINEAIDFSSRDEYIKFEFDEINKVCQKLFRGNLTVRRYSEDERHLGGREYVFEFSIKEVPMKLNFNLWSNWGHYGKSGSITYKSNIYMPPDPKNMKRAEFVDIPKPPKGTAYMVKEFEGTNEKKAVQMATSHIKQFSKSIEKAIGSSKFQDPVVNNRFPDAVQNVNKVIKS